MKKFNIDYKDILDNEGLTTVKVKNKEKKINWWEAYSFANEDEYETWKEKAKEKIRSFFQMEEEEDVEREFTEFDMVHGAPQSYLFKQQQGLL